MTEPARRLSSRLTLLGLVALFAAPLAAAFWMYYGTGWRPSGTTNQGALIEPVRQLQALSFVDPATRPALEKLFTGKWSLVVVGDGVCDEACRTTLVYARQTYIGLGRLGMRVQRVLLVPSGCCDQDYLQREHAGLIVADLSGADAALANGRDALLGAFSGDRRQIFIVDPLGNLMMSYDTRLDPKGLRSDLKKLLDLSHIG
jgi:hypothetical protein